MAKSSESLTQVRELSRTHDTLLTVGALLGSLCVIATLVGLLVGAKPLVFRSGSMSPAITTGALAVSLPVEASDIHVGDVLSVENTTGVRVTHRVVSVDIDRGVAAVRLKGDANDVPDAVPYTLRQADRVIFSAPLLGYFVAWLSSSAAVFAGGFFTAYLLYLAFGQSVARKSSTSGDDNSKPGSGWAGRKIVRRNRPARHPGNKTRDIRLQAGTTAFSIVVLTASALHTAAPSHAAFLDYSTASGSFTSASLIKPGLSCDNSGSYDVKLTLTHPGDFAEQYELHSLLPAKLWAAASWKAGNTVSVILDADDAAFNFNRETTVNFRASSKFGSWTSVPELRDVKYSPEANILFLGFVPASLRC